ncbi:hypothetical protein J2Z22_000659 [Paenibacillus forsythiae]|uniref:Mutator family transposase n=1 Tax=Paenibacillus forsythiae TaxID=365616 RepID=A0ABU3H3W6_9BACL|nr:transposase [Paenibacillus forsythiae]MDT3425146.1 hypothetical protein [Paenibacillus forsythiae]
MHLYEWYLTLLRASLTPDVKKDLTSVVETYKGLLLSMDGVQPEKGNETLYVVREGFSGRILAAKNLKSGSKTELMALLKPLKDLGLPVIGLVSDGQKSIRLAMEETWPDTPYQYCPYHYLKDIAKPVVNLDRKLKTGLKKSLWGLREIEKQVQDDDSVEDAFPEQTFFIEASKDQATPTKAIPLSLSTFGADRGEVSAQLFMEHERVGEFARQFINNTMDANISLKQVEKIIGKIGPGYERFRLEE